MSKIETVYLPFYKDEKRRIDIYLPNNFSPTLRYKVIYFHDGQNLFFDEEATYGTCWGIKKLCDEMNYQYIIVGIFNGGKERCNEYSPFHLTFEPAIISRPFWNKNEGAKYAQWIVEVLKPYIDFHYPTISSFEGSAICGSSLGGVMSSYIGSKYHDIFKYVGVYSLASWYNEKEHLKFIKKQEANLNQKYLVYVGTKECSVENASNMEETYLMNTKNYFKVLEEKGFKDDHLFFYLGNDETHSEASWSKYIDYFFKMLENDLKIK